MRDQSNRRLARLGSRQAAIDELAVMRWGRANNPILSVLFLLLASNYSQRRAEYLAKMAVSRCCTELEGTSTLATASASAWLKRRPS